MNRLAKFSVSGAKRTTSHVATPTRSATADSSARAAGDSLRYRLLGPVGYEKNYAYPLIVWLHGPGDHEDQVLRIMPHVSLRNYVAVGVRGTRSDLDGRAATWSLDNSAVDRARQLVDEAISVAGQRYNLHPGRIFLAGLEEGGTLALRIALSQPEKFAGAASIGGCFPMGSAALWRYQAARNLPLLLLRGLESSRYPDQVFRDEIKLFHAARLIVHARQYPCGDEVTTFMLRDFNAWIMERVTGEPVLAQLDSASPAF